MNQAAAPVGITYTVRDGVAEIGLANPPVNAITVPMIDELLAAFERARLDASAKVVLLHSGLERRFCAGLDLVALDGAEAETVRSLLERLYTGLTEAQFRLGKPSIAAVNGTARGGGMTLAISCDMLVAAADATFGYPEIDVGVLPAIHFTHLHRVVGRHRAFDLLFTGRTFDAAEAHALGLVSRVVPAGDVMQEARALAQRLAGKPATALRLGREAFHNACDTGYRRGVAGAVETFCGVAATAEAKAGIADFVRRRKG